MIAQNRLALALAVALALPTVGCSASAAPTPAAPPPPPVVAPVAVVAASAPAAAVSAPVVIAAPKTPADVAAMKAEADALWEQRGDRKSMEGALARYEQLAKANPADLDAMYHLTRGFFFFADVHESTSEARIPHLYTSITWGTRCLASNKEYSALLDKGVSEVDAAKAFKAGDVPCLFWTAVSLGRRMREQGMHAKLKDLGVTKAFMLRSGELEPGYFFHGADRFMGIYYAAIPEFLGGDPKKGQELLASVIKAHPTFLTTHVVMASEWAVKTKNKEVFEKELLFAINADPGAVPGVRPEMESEQRKAKEFLSQKDSLF